MIPIKSKAQFEQVIAGDLVLIDFYGITCAPCKIYAEELNKVAYDLPYVTIAKVCTDELQDLAREFQVNAVPTTLIYQRGELKERYMGAKESQWVRNRLAEYLYG